MNGNVKSNQNNVAFITGVSSGIGRETATLLAEQGFRVFGTARNLMTTDPIAGVELIRMDVTDDASVADGVNSVLKATGQIQFLVNNAGYALAGALEETTIQEAQEQFDTNFFGVLRVTRALLPTMRRQGNGRIVNISSMLGLLPAPYRGIYAASKHALEGYTETLDHEVRKFGIRAVLVEPTFTKTNIAGNEKVAQLKLDSYTDQGARVNEVVNQRIARGDEPRAVAEVVCRALIAESPRARYPVGEGVTISRLRRFVPARMFDKSFRKQFRLDEPARGRGLSRVEKTSEENDLQPTHANDL